ncbi:unnamed protein product [Caenorhabditis sp. 36 PRJEB53466]|nr:unnamed protein product [Caenorhabditis sp. 36 PRJEB53466]
MTESEIDRVYLQLYDYETKEFSGLTTYHGLVRIYNSNTWPSRIFWSVVVLSCLSLFMIHSGYLLLGYHAKPTLFQVNTIVPTNGIIFPDVTICNLNYFDLEKIKSLNMSGSVFSYIVRFFNEISYVQNMATVNEHEEYQNFTDQYKHLTGKVFYIPDFLKSNSKRCEDTIVSCSFGRRQIENCCDRIVTELTESGICYRLSSDNTRRQWYSGSGFGWEIIVNGNNEHKIRDQYSNYNVDYGFTVMVHEHDKYPRINSFAVSVSPGDMLHASLVQKNITLLDTDNWGSCTKGWEEHIQGLPYTANHCETECKRLQTETLCNCSPLAYSAQLSNCLASQNSSWEWEKLCDCASECKLLEFEITTSYSTIPKEVATNLNYTGKQVESDISFISLYFRQVSYDFLEQQKQLQTADLLSNIAGSMGLFLGMSTVTLLEIFIYLFKSVWGTVNSARQKQFVDAVAEEEREKQQSILIIQNTGSENDENNIADIRVTKKEEEKYSGSSIHIHLDRRNSRMIRGGDLFSPPRGSVNIPSQILSPLSKHCRKSISAGPIGRKTSSIGLSMLTSREDSSNSSNPLLRKNSFMVPSVSLKKRNSTVSQPDKPLATHAASIDKYTKRIAGDVTLLSSYTSKRLNDSLISAWPSAHNGILKEQILRIVSKPGYVDDKHLKIVADLTHPLLINTGIPNHVYEMLIVRAADEDYDLSFDGIGNHCSLTKGASGFDTIIGRTPLNSANQQVEFDVAREMFRRSKYAEKLNITIQFKMEYVLR